MLYEYMLRTQVYRHKRERSAKQEQPLKWALAIVIFVLALSVTFAEVGG